MNKTVSINLAGIFFHIDDDAYLKLQRYLDTIKSSFTESQGRTEILSDIEARIAELFNERLNQTKQVISLIDVEQIIVIMGQPEDYLVDNEIFEEETKEDQNENKTANKRLFRDKDNAHIGGVASGVSHYFGVDAIWVRLAWVFLFLFMGTGLFLYVLLWVLVPEAKTTAEKLTMKGKPVNVNSIEKKIKDGFDDVSKSVKKNSNSFFDGVFSVINNLFQLVGKLIGFWFIVVGFISFIALVFALLSFNSMNFIFPGLNHFDVVDFSEIPLWVVVLVLFLTVGIPLFFIFYFGIKLLVKNLKSIGNFSIFTLLGVWVISIIGLIFIVFKQVNNYAYTEAVLDKQELIIQPADTLKVKMEIDDVHTEFYRQMKVLNNELGKKTIYSNDVEVIVKSTTAKEPYIIIKRIAKSNNNNLALERAKNIDYSYEIKGNRLELSTYLSTAAKNKLSWQAIVVLLYLPEGMLVEFDENTGEYLHHNSIIYDDYTGNLLKIIDDDIKCLDCKSKLNVDVENEDLEVKINENGVEIKDDNVNIEIDENGIHGEVDGVNIDIDDEGVNVESRNNE